METDPDDFQKAKSLDMGYLDSETGMAAIVATQWPDGRPVRGIYCGALHRLHTAERQLANIHAREAQGAGAPVAPATTTDNDASRSALVTDQADEGVFKALSPSALPQSRQAHIKVAGDAPLSAARPTADQFAALNSKVAAGRSPYVDFAVFGPSRAKFRSGWSWLRNSSKGRLPSMCGLSVGGSSRLSASC